MKIDITIKNYKMGSPVNNEIQNIIKKITKINLNSSKKEIKITLMSQSLKS